MRPTGGDLAGHDHEFDEVRWFDLAEAGGILTFESERGWSIWLPQRVAADARVARGAPSRRIGRLSRWPDAIDDTVKITPLVERHRALGARLIDFAGWLMPVQYSGIIEEHRAVRERAGLFDLSHMGELFVEGPEAGAALAHALVQRPAGAGGRAGPLLDDLSPRTAGSSTT